MRLHHVSRISAKCTARTGEVTLCVLIDPRKPLTAALPQYRGDQQRCNVPEPDRTLSLFYRCTEYEQFLRDNDLNVVTRHIGRSPGLR